MKISYNWLKDFVDLSDVSAEDVAGKLMISGFEIEEILYMNKYVKHVYVGRITKIEKHPSADRLVVCQVDVGDKNVQIVTSATNVFEGALVPVSLAGASLANGVQIQPTKFRGVDSDGMFCSGEELGIDDNYIDGASINGILILPAELNPGEKIEDALMLNDVVFDVSVTPNRPDCNSVVGIAREVCAMFNKTFISAVDTFKTIDEDIKNYLSVDVQTENCPRYMASYIKNVRLRRSPLWLRSRLHAVGIKPINNMVDITNYILIEQGQPMHAFDYEFLSGKKIVVRQAKKGEKIAVLNGNTYELDETNMVIADQDKPVVIAGVIGGVNSCISNQTEETVFECASFDLKSVRLTAKKFGLRTDSSARFEKGVNVNCQEIAMKRALYLVSKLDCGDIVSGVIDKVSAGVGLDKQDELKLSYSKICSILGFDFDKNKALQILNSLNIKSKLDGDVLTCVAPAIRDDIHNENDIAEELIRIYGYSVYNDIDTVEFEKSINTFGKRHPMLVLENTMKNGLVDMGFFETLNYSLYNENACDKLLLKSDDIRRKVIKIANPLNEDIATARTVMAHALFLDIAYNLSVGNHNFRFFESGKIYLPKSLPLTELPIENERLSFAVCEDGFDFFMLKAVVENLLCATSLKYKIQRSNEPYLHPGVSADVVDEATGKVVGSFGKVHRQVLKNYEISQDVYYGEVDIDFLTSLPEKRFETKDVSKYQSVERDIAVVVDENVTNEELMSAIKSACGKIFYDVELFDVYRNASLGDNKKSVAYKITFLSNEKTLTSDEINSAFNKVVRSLEFRFGAKLR